MTPIPWLFKSRMIANSRSTSWGVSAADGSFETLPEAYTALGQWLENNDYEMNGAMREIYLSAPDANGAAVDIARAQAPERSAHHRIGE